MLMPSKISQNAKTQMFSKKSEQKFESTLKAQKAPFGSTFFLINFAFSGVSCLKKANKWPDMSKIIQTWMDAYQGMPTCS